MVSVCVGIVGASGETGGSIVDGLLGAGGFTIIALTRPASIEKPANHALKQKGVEIRPLDLGGSQAELVEGLQDVEVLISAIVPMELLEQIPLVTAAKTAGVKRFVGIHLFRDLKEQVYNHIKRLWLPYTIVDVGWWYQLSLERLPSGRTDYAISIPHEHLAGDGNTPSALIHVEDVGRYMAKIIVDDRTLNKQVMVYNEMWSQNQICDLHESLSGEKVSRSYQSSEELHKIVETGMADVPSDPEALKTPEGFAQLVRVVPAQYVISWGIRGDNTPDYARYLGSLTSDELYPGFQGVKFKDYMQQVMDGKAKVTYAEMAARFKKANAET